MAFTVAIPHDITNTGKNFLLEKGHTLVIGTNPSEPEQLKKEIAGADAILARLASFTADVLAAAPNLKVIGRHGIGVDNIDLDYCTRHGVQVTFAPFSNAVSVAEKTIAFMMALAGNVVRFDTMTKSGKWRDRLSPRSVDLERKTLGIVGFGRIGRAVATRCRAAFSMNVLAYAPSLQAGTLPEGVTPATTEEIFRQADFVSMHTPSTPETRGMANAKAFGMMKNTAYFINCSRGDVVVEDDLRQALTDNVIAGAALDVLAEEPPPPDHPLFSLSNIILAPHTASATVEALDRMGLHAAMGIDDVLAGRKPEWPVNNPAPST